MSTQDLITTAQAAEHLDVERSTLTRWVQLGKIAPAMKLPGQTGTMLFAIEDLDRLAADRDASKAAS